MIFDNTPYPKPSVTWATQPGDPTLPDYRAFAIEVMKGFPDGFPDGFDLQDLAVKHGLLIGHRVVEPCGENCLCSGYFDDLSKGETCYRRHADMMQ